MRFAALRRSCCLFCQFLCDRDTPLSSEPAAAQLPEDDALFLDILAGTVNDPAAKRRCIESAPEAQEKLQAAVQMFEQPEPKVSTGVNAAVLHAASHL